MENNRYKLLIDLKPDFPSSNDARILRIFSENINRIFGNSLSKLFTCKACTDNSKVVRGYRGEEKVNQITKRRTSGICKTSQSFSADGKSIPTIEEAIITSGGINIKEINPKTMESKKKRDFSFAGEVIDVDGYTGGFNLQIAFSTAYCAALNM